MQSGADIPTVLQFVAEQAEAGHIGASPRDKVKDPAQTAHPLVVVGIIGKTQSGNAHIANALLDKAVFPVITRNM